MLLFEYKYDRDDFHYVTDIDFASYMTTLIINHDYYSIKFALDLDGGTGIMDNHRNQQHHQRSMWILVTKNISESLSKSDIRSDQKRP